MTKDDIAQFYDANLGIYSEFQKKLHNDLDTILKGIGLPNAVIESRVKSRDGFIDKSIKFKYTDLKNQFTDFAALRIITQNTEEVYTIANEIEKEYAIDWINSSDKKKALNVDQVGYISNHYIISLDNDELGRRGNQRFAGLKAELQIRTYLQHAWAELSHDKVYKNKGNLTPEILRKVNVFSGLLEIADEHIMNLNKEIDEIIMSTSVQSTSELNAITLMGYMNNKFDFLKDKLFIDANSVLKELNLMGITQISKLNELVKADYYNYIKKHHEFRTYDGIIRNILAINFKEKYFTDCCIKSISQYTRDMLNYFKDKIDFDIDFYCNQSNIMII